MFPGEAQAFIGDVQLQKSVSGLHVHTQINPPFIYKDERMEINAPHSMSCYVVSYRTSNYISAF